MHFKCRYAAMTLMRGVKSRICIIALWVSHEHACGVAEEWLMVLKCIYSLYGHLPEPMNTACRN